MDFSADQLVKYVPHVLIIGAILWLAVWLLILLDSDFVTFTCRWLGRRPASLKNKVIWITGSSVGIGARLAVQMGRSGAKLVLSATRKEMLDQVKAECLAANNKLTDSDVLVLPLDMTNLDHHNAAFEQVIKQFGHLDVLVHNAARYQSALFEEVELSVERQLFELNVFAVVNLTRIAVNHWLTNKQQGHLVAVSSIAGFCPAPASSAYGATKHALIGYFDSLRVEYSTRGIAVTIICPGPVATDLLANAMTSRPDTALNIAGKFPLPVMSPDRCAFLIAVAIANRIKYAWTINQPYLLASASAAYMPFFSRWVTAVFVSADRVRRMAKADYS